MSCFSIVAIQVVMDWTIVAAFGSYFAIVEHNANAHLVGRHYWIIN